MNSIQIQTVSYVYNFGAKQKIAKRYNITTEHEPDENWTFNFYSGTQPPLATIHSLISRKE